MKTVKLYDIGVERSLINNGDVLETGIPGILHAEIGDVEGVVIFEDRISSPGDLMERLGVKTLYGYKMQSFKGLLVGLTDMRGTLTGLGIVESLDMNKGEITVYTPAPSFTSIQFGSIRLNRESCEYIGPFQPMTYGASFLR